MQKKKVDAEAWYSVQDIVSNRMFPWVVSFASIRKIIEKDKKGKNILKASIIGKGRGKKYHIHGANIIKFVESFKNGVNI